VNICNSKIIEHWSNRDNVRSLESALGSGDPSMRHPDLDDLAPRDQMHAGTMDATKKLTRWLGVERGSRVLDLGSGLGASARFLARYHGCAVTALDLCPALHVAGREITRRCGLEGSVRHLCGDFGGVLDALGGPFDLVWIQHVDMQVGDKTLLYRTVAGLLAVGGRIAWHDWLAGPAGPPEWPVFWTGDGALSCLVDRHEFERLLYGAGLELTRFEPLPEETVAWFDKGRRAVLEAIERLGRKASTPSERVARLERLLLEMDNAIANTRERRMIPFFGEARARG